MSAVSGRRGPGSPGDPGDPLSQFLPAVSGWFRDTLGVPTAAQERAWPLIAAGRHLLVSAPTGSGKTLAAFLWALDRLFRDGGSGDDRAGVDVLYVSPLKALNYDIERNLALPLEGIREREPGLDDVDVGVRTGDTPQAERRRLVRRPPRILITTPESLYLLLTSRSSRPTLAGVRTVIVDEIHAVCATKRGTHLALSLERLADLCGGADPQRIGLSATVRPLGRVAAFLGGVGRDVEVVDEGSRRPMQITVAGTAAAEDGSVWPRLTESLLADVAGHRTTLMFVNSRRAAERLVGRLNDAAAGTEPTERLAADVSTDVAEGEGGRVLPAAGAAPQSGEPAARAAPQSGEYRAHHGSVAHPVRTELEEALAGGRLRTLVATGTLELGIDIGSVDLVCQVESPKTVARGIQRVGRSGHRVEATSVGRLYPVHRGDLVESAALARGMVDGDIEEVRIPSNCLDVLAQQIVAEVAARDVTGDALFDLCRRADPFRGLQRAAFDAVVGLLAGETVDPDLPGVTPRVVADRATGMLRARPGAARVAVTSGGTIPDRGLYPVRLAGSGVRLGELDEEFVFESKPGDVFVLGSSAWRITDIGRDRVEVVEAPGTLARMPFWHGEGLGRPASVGRRVGALLREAEAALDDDAGLASLASACRLDAVAGDELTDHLRRQRGAAAVPTDRRIVVESYADEVGDWRVVLHSVAGGRVNFAWGLVLAARLRDELGFGVEWVHGDDGVMIRLPGDVTPPADVASLVAAGDVEEAVLDELAGSTLFAAHFRENAARALLLPRNRPGRRTPLWLQRLRAADLLAWAGRDPDFPIVVETFRECLDDVLEVPALRRLLEGIEAGEVEVVPVATAGPSPFAQSFLYSFTEAFLYSGDVARAEARATALGVNRELLAGLVGDGTLRDLLERSAVEEVVGQVTRTARGWRARDEEEVLDLLHRFGDLALVEVDARSDVDAAEALARLGERVREVGDRWVAAEEAADFEAVLAGAADPGPWLRRAALGRGPFTAADLAARYGRDVGDVTRALEDLAGGGLLERGGFLPGGEGEEWVASAVLTRMHRRSLALLRRQASAVDGAAYARFLVGRHTGRVSSGRAGLERALALLEGCPLHAGLVESDVLPRRVDGYDPFLLDGVLAAGEWSWLGLGGARVAFVRPERAGLVSTAADSALSETAAGVNAFLARGGGWRSDDLAVALDMDLAGVEAALAELLWAGLATNDSFGPARHRPRGQAASATPKRRRGRPEPPSAPGPPARWSAVRRVDVVGTPGAGHVVAGILLERHGVVAYESWAAESWAPSWADVRGALGAMEARGDVRRGYFVEGLSGVQYARATTVETLRRAGERAGDPTPEVLAAADPANPWGLVFPGAGVRRSAGALVVLEAGVAVLTCEGSRVTPLSERPLEAFAPALAALGAARGRRRLIMERWARRPAVLAAAAFTAAGWRRTPKGFRPPA